jgi:malate dehydrogenase
MKISIIGAGNVGGLTALHLCSQGFTDIVLVDAVAKLAHAKALDLSDARYILKQNYQIQSVEDINKIADSEILIITAGIPRRPGMTREELVQKNSCIIKEISGKVKNICPEAVIIVVTNPLDIMTYLVIKETNFPSHHIMGMGLTLDRARLANLIAQKLKIAVTDIEPCMIGVHGEGMLPLSRYTKVNNKPLQKYLESDQISDIFRKTVQRGAEIVSFLGSGSAYFAPSAAIAELTNAIAKDQKCILPVSVYLSGQYGLADLCIGLPCCIGRGGIESIIELELNSQERAALIKSAESVKKQISLINNRIQVKTKS